jgi:AhpD family alkylhydroperoxidase
MIVRSILDDFEAKSGEDMSYAREIARETPAGFWKLALHGPLVRHCGTTPAALVALAKLGAVHAEDCGPCVQIGVKEALRAGVEPALLRQALAGGEALPPLERDAYFFGRGVAGADPLDDELRGRLEAAVGRRGLVDLTLGAAAVRIFPALKRGLGYARSCSVVPIEV